MSMNWRIKWSRNSLLVILDLWLCTDGSKLRWPWKGPVTSSHLKCYLHSHHMTTFQAVGNLFALIMSCQVSCDHVIAIYREDGKLLPPAERTPCHFWTLREFSLIELSHSTRQQKQDSKLKGLSSFSAPGWDILFCTQKGSAPAGLQKQDSHSKDLSSISATWGILFCMQKNSGKLANTIILKVLTSFPWLGRVANAIVLAIILKASSPNCAIWRRRLPNDCETGVHLQDRMKQPQ